MDNVERVGPDMGQIPRDTFGETLEFRVRVKSKSHMDVGYIKDRFAHMLDSTLYDILFIKEIKHFNREE